MRANRSLEADGSDAEAAGKSPPLSIAERLERHFGKGPPLGLLGEDFDSGVDRVAEKAGIAHENERAELLEILAARAHAAIPPEEGSAWPKKYALDIALVLLAALLGSLAVRAYLIWDRHEAEPVTAELSSFLPAEKAAPSSADLQGRVLVTLPVAPGSLRLVGRPPTWVSLALVSPGPEGESSTVFRLRRVPLLSIDRDGDEASIVVALPPAQADRALGQPAGVMAHVVRPLPKAE